MSLSLVVDSLAWESITNDEVMLLGIMGSLNPHSMLEDTAD